LISVRVLTASINLNGSLPLFAVEQLLSIKDFTMKKFKTMVLCALFYVGINGAYAKDIVIGVSPYTESDKLQQYVRQSLQFATGLEAGDRVTFMDAYHLNVIGVFKVPENKAYKSEKARLVANKKTVGQLMQFAKQPPQGNVLPSVKNTVRLPQFLRYVAQNISGQHKTDVHADVSVDVIVDVIVLGSPFYDDPSDAAFSMAGGIIPGDGHLQVGRDQSVFGIVGQEQLLSTLRVHLVYGDAVMQSDRHAYHIERFWQLFVSRQSGALVTFAPEISTALSHVNTNAAALPDVYKIQKTDRLEMIRLRDVEIKTSIHERPLSSIMPTAQQLRHAKNLEVGITWDCENCDLDLYLRPLPSSAILYFGYPKSNEGVYYKDFRNSPVGVGGFESIELSIPVDLRSVAIAVNFYSGEVKDKLTGHIRMAIDGQTYAMNFTINALSGNKGKDVLAAFSTPNRSNRNTPHTLFINPLSILGLAS